jgi:Phage integrase family
MTAGALSRRLAGLGQGAGVERAALHRLRHGVATYLVDHGLLLKAQARPGHRDPATTLRHYSHATRSMTPTRQTGSTASSTAWTPGTPGRKVAVSRSARPRTRLDSRYYGVWWSASTEPDVPRAAEYGAADGCADRAGCCALIIRFWVGPWSLWGCWFARIGGVLRSWCR